MRGHPVVQVVPKKKEKCSGGFRSGRHLEMPYSSRQCSYRASSFVPGRALLGAIDLSADSLPPSTAMTGAWFYTT